MEMSDDWAQTYGKNVHKTGRLNMPDIRLFEGYNYPSIRVCLFNLIVLCVQNMTI